MRRKRTTYMISKAAFLNKTTLKKVNRALAEAGYSEYPGDSTTAYPNGCNSGYVSNLLTYLEPTDQAAQRKILQIVDQVVS